MVELLVGIAIAGVTLAAAVRFLAVHAQHLRRHALRLETQQAMRASLDAITRDLRLAGACLPTDGQFVALAGANAPAGDSITIRTGVVRTNMSCIVTSLTALAPQGATALPVGSASGFTSDMLGYVRHPNGGGQMGRITAAGGTSITFADAMVQDYPVGSGVYAIDERAYALDRSDPALPLLMLTVNRGAPQAFAAGVSDLQVRYVLDRNCPACDTVDLPADTAEWRLVNVVQLSASVQTVGGRPADSTTLVAAGSAKPRNLLP